MDKYSLSELDIESIDFSTVQQMASRDSFKTGKIKSLWLCVDPKKDSLSYRILLQDSGIQAIVFTFKEAVEIFNSL